MIKGIKGMINIDGIDIKIPVRVIFLNTSNGEVFFDCSPHEARIAKEEIERFRISGKSFKKHIEDVNIVKNAVFSYRGRAKRLKNLDNTLLTLNSLNLAFVEIEKKDLLVDYIFMNAIDYATIRNFGKSVYSEASYQEVKELGILGEIFNAKIIVNSKIRVGNLFLVSYESSHESYDDVIFKKPYIVKIRFGK